MDRKERPCSEFSYSEDFTVTPDVLRAFRTNGYVIIRGLFDSVEVSMLKTALEADQGVMKMNYSRDDGAGRKNKAVLWNQPGNDITGVIARSEKMAGTFDQLLGGEVYHYHTKVIMKETHTGGQFTWHQDYGYWYENGCMFPDMGTVWVAVDAADKQNGCMQFLVGSHLMGRVDHKQVGEEVGADLERVEQAKSFCPLVHCEASPGDAIFFHCNLLHHSDQNRSDRRRWAFLVAYNRADNDPVYVHHHPKYSKLNKVPNCEIKSCSTVADITGKDFFKGAQDDQSLDKIAQKAGVHSQPRDK